MTTRYTHAIAVALALTVIPAAALAQGGPGMMGRGDGGPGSGMGWHMWGGGWGGSSSRWGRGPQGMLDRIDGRLAFLKAELKITDAQEAQWKRFADVISTAAKRMNERMQTIWSGEEKARTLAERLDVQEEAASIRLEEVKQLKSAFKDLYSVLTEDQRKEADTLALPMMGMGGGSGGMMGAGPGAGTMRR